MCVEAWFCQIQSHIHFYYSFIKVELSMPSSIFYPGHLIYKRLRPRSGYKVYLESMNRVESSISTVYGQSSFFITNFAALIIAHPYENNLKLSHLSVFEPMH